MKFSLMKNVSLITTRSIKSVRTKNSLILYQMIVDLHLVIYVGIILVIRVRIDPASR